MPTPETRAAVQYDKAWARQYKTLEKSHDAWIFPPGVAESQSATHSKTGRLMDELLETAVDDFVQRLDPEDAVDYAVKHGGSDALRAAASRWAECALFYAQHVDRGPHPVTRKGACRNPENAFWYALEIDRRPTPETRLGVSVDPGWRSRYEEAENYPERWLTHTEPEILESIGELIQRHYVTFDQQPEDGRYLGTPAVWDEACNKWKVMGIEDDVYLHRPARLISAPIEGFVDHDWEQDLDAAEVTVIKDLKPSEWYPDFEDPTAVRLPLLPPPIEEASTRRTPTGRSEAILAWLNAKISAVKVDRATASHTDITSHLWDTDPAYAKVAKVGLEVGFNSQAQGLGRRTADKLLTHAIHWGNLPKSGQVYLSPAEWDAVHDRWFVAETSSDSHLTRDAYLVSCLVGAWERQDNFSADAKDITVLKRLDRVEWYFGGVEDPTSVPLPLEVPKIEETQKPLFRQPLSPEDALQWARYYGTSKETRDVCLKFPHWAYMYAMYVDHKPSDDTRQAVLPDVTWSERYAKNVDKYPHPVILARHGSDAISTKHADYAPIPQPEAVNDEDRSWVPDVHESALMQKDKVASAAWAGKVKAQMKACWANAVKAVKRGPDNLVYVEGFASLAKFNGIVVEHGWVEDGETIIDPTLPEADAEYFPGVRYTKAQVKELSKDREPPFVWGGDGGFGGYSNKDYKAAHDLAWSKLLPNEPKLLGESISDDCRAAEEAYRQALTEGPSDKTRAAACLIDHHAYMYALYVDKGPRDDTRAAACRDSFIACSYALNVDRMPRDDTRKSASRSKDSAVKYAISVDKYPHPDLVAAQGGLISQHPASYIAEPTVE